MAAPSADEVFLFTDWRMWINTFDAIEDSGFRVRAMIVWDKKYGGLGAGWRSQHELIGYGKKTSVVPGAAPSMGNVLSISRTGNKLHPTEKPVELIELLLTGSPAQTVLDPFMGSGTTGVACLRLGRKFIGIEIEPNHFDTACRRLEKERGRGDFLQTKQTELIGRK